MARLDACHRVGCGSIYELIREAFQAICQGASLRDFKLAPFVRFSRADKLDDSGHYVEQTGRSSFALDREAQPHPWQQTEVDQGRSRTG